MKGKYMSFNSHMIDEGYLRERLSIEKSNFVTQAMKHPQKRDAFEYGFLIGKFHGYESSISLIQKIVEEKEKELSFDEYDKI